MTTQTNPVSQAIVLEGVRVHNLKNISLTIRRHALTVICGVSGSGKSSLAFDTLYAEGQRRYLETFSASARLFLDRIERPAADRIDGIPPAIAVRQNPGSLSERSTVGTVTEIVESLRLLFVRAGSLQCHFCGGSVGAFTPDTAAEWLKQHRSGRRALVVFTPENSGDDAANQPSQVIAELLRRGYTRGIRRDSVVSLEQAGPDGAASGSLLVVQDRIRIEEQSAVRLTESIETALELGGGACRVLCEAGMDPAVGTEPAWMTARRTIDGQSWTEHQFATQYRCAGCQRVYAEPAPELLSHTSPLGACPRCSGVGSVVAADTGHPDPGTGTSSRARRARRVRCEACLGTRLNPDAAIFRLAGLRFLDVIDLELCDLAAWVDGLAGHLSQEMAQALQSLTERLRSRLTFLLDCGLGYLSLSRALRTLSTGELQRVLLTTALGSGLVHALYVLDEPTRGLHATETTHVIRAARKLRDAGNTVIVVEHDPQFILSADEVIEIGPGAGGDGGQVVFQGEPDELLRRSDSATGVALREAPRTAAGAPRATAAPPPEHWLRVRGARCHNLSGIDVDIPLGVVCAIVGVSGSGKSSLITGTVYPALCRLKGQTCDTDSDGTLESLQGAEQFDQVLLLDQTTVPRSRRSVPATWMGFFDDIRRLLAETHEARKRHCGPGTFSFNSSRGGRCPKCEGLGLVTIAMHFLADIETTCDECGGQRFRADVTEIRYRDRSVHEILMMTADTALAFFAGQHRIQQRLNAMRLAGLGYLRLGQSFATMSGGEMQRMRIAALLAGLSSSGSDRSAAPRIRTETSAGPRTLFLLDEPSTGLHLLDIDRLAECLSHLIRTGNSVCLIDHDERLLRLAEYVIELGPGPGKLGGRVVAAGPVLR